MRKKIFWKKMIGSTMEESKYRAFTLVEILVVLSLTGLIFSLLLISFSRSVDSSLNVIASSESLSERINLFWDLQRKILGAKDMLIERNSLYMITSGGSFYRGVVKCAYVFKDDGLYYYEFPYPYGAIDQLEEEKLIKVADLNSFRVTALERGKELKVFRGLPRFVKVRIDDQEFIFEVIR